MFFVIPHPCGMLLALVVLCTSIALHYLYRTFVEMFNSFYRNFLFIFQKFPHYAL